jgi:hypothetical protein
VRDAALRLGVQALARPQHADGAAARALVVRLDQRLAALLGDDAELVRQLFFCFFGVVCTCAREATAFLAWRAAAAPSSASHNTHTHDGHRRERCGAALHYSLSSALRDILRSEPIAAGSRFVSTTNAVRFALVRTTALALQDVRAGIQA